MGSVPPVSESFAERVAQLRAQAMEFIVAPVLDESACVMCDGCGVTAAVDASRPELPEGWRQTDRGDVCPNCNERGDDVNYAIAASKAELLALLDDMRAGVESGDTLEGSVQFLLPYPPAGEPEHADFMVVARYRVGNLAGQGGLRSFGAMDRPDSAPITRHDVDRFTFREYRKTVLTKISDEVLPAGARVGTLEGECVGSEPSRLAIDVAGNLYLVEERMFARSYIVARSYVEDASSPSPPPPPTPN